MNEYEDTYFFSAEEAYRVALEQNRSEDDTLLQVCYYDGEKLDTDVVNLIHLPIDNLLEDLARGRYRLPTKVSLEGMELSEAVKLDIIQGFDMSLFQVKDYRNQYNKHYYNSMKTAKLDFDEPLRFYLLANAQTQVMQHVSKSIANTLKREGYDVLFDLYCGIEDVYSVQKICEFNPHVVVNINAFNNHYLSEDCFNFVWFQDAMPILQSSELIDLRQRDYIYSLVAELDRLLEQKSIPFLRQSFCLNNDVYKLDESVERKKKIVFIGSSYYTSKYDSDELSPVIDKLIQMFNAGESFTNKKIDLISQEFHVDREYLGVKIIPYVVRDLSVLWLCSIESDYEIEIYGYGWEHYEGIQSFYKGSLAYGDDIAKVYNSATFCFSPHQTYLLQQRVLESSACGAIPITYDCRDISDGKDYEEALVFFKTKDDLTDILTQKELHKKDFINLLNENDYKVFTDRILKVIKKGLIDE
ncbi:hypothetical protein MNB_SM-4-469 [hydrothermal vent metagenome]|uniref:Spore protein YkvP/CgeB glycosyl transferase-like domain-containing protein n=1 Tax=hydrothermal vent metagenome TaxID=652676 RepID=A0A1W1BBL2_9ZZZZ